MKRYNGFEPRMNSSRKTLPAGGYVAKIMGAEDMDFSNGPALAVSFDIAEGEYTEFFADDYRSSTFGNKKWRGITYLTQPAGDGSDRDGWAVNAMNNLVAVLQDSNSGYTWNWDPIEQGNYSQLKGKRIGVLMGRVQWEYKGKTGWSTKCRAIIPVKDVQEGHFQIPEDKPLKTPTVTQSSSWKNESSGTKDDLTEAFDSDDDLPF